MAAKRKVDFAFGDENALLQESYLKELMRHKTEFLDLVSNIETQKLVAITISNCNAMFNYSFTDAQIQRTRNVAFIYYKTLFKIELLKHFFENGVLPDELEDQKRTAVLSSLQMLARYLSDYECNKEIVEKYSDGSASEWTSILAAHLFKKLAPESKTTLSDVGYSKLQNCPCKCGTPLQYGDTSLGNNNVWHGCVDIICNNKLIDIATSTTEDVEVKSNNSNFDQSQVLAKAIVTSFALKRPSPLISVSRNRIQLYMYIPESDILLEGAPFLLTVDNHLQLKGVFFVWLFLNYNIFQEDLSRTIKRGMPASDFKTLVGDKLDIYQRAIHFGGCKRKPDKESDALEFFYGLGSGSNFSEK